MISKCKKIAKEKLQNNYSVFIVITLIMLAISLVFSLIFIDYKEQKISWWYYLIYLIVPVFQIGMIICSFKVLNNEVPEFSDAFSGFKKYFKIIWASLLVLIYTMLWSLLIIPAFIKPFSYAMTMRIIIDEPDLTVNEAITKSREIMDGHKMQLFLLCLSFIGWLLLSVLTFGILFLWVNPHIETTISQYYLEINGKNDKKVNKNGLECGKTISYEDLDAYLKGKKCPSCGKTQAYNTSYCTECGRQLNEDNCVIEKKCPSCGKMHPVSSYYCPDCGRKLD